MKISVEKSEKVAESFSFAEICKIPGVWKSEGGNSTYMLVSAYKDVVYVDVNIGVAKAPSPDLWGSTRFVRANVKIVIES